MAHNASSKDLHITRQFTTLRLNGGIDCVPGKPGCPYPDLDVRGGARIGKSLCLEGDLTVDNNVCIVGDLKVLGNTTIKKDEIVVVASKNICLANPANVVSSNITANGGGIIVRGPDPDESKTILWYLDGPWWHFNQDINLGPGRLPFEPNCGGDQGLSGKDYRILGNSVLNLTTLGNTVVCSFLEKVGALREGSIEHYIAITGIAVGPSTKITTSKPHGLSVNDNVRIVDSDSTPAIDGCHRVTSVVSSTMFEIATTIVGPGTSGKLKGVMFPIDIGTSTITSGTHCIQCSGNLVVKDNTNTERFKVIGSTGKTIITNDSVLDCALEVLSDISGDYNTLQKVVCIDNSTNNTDIQGVSCALDIDQSYTGTNTVYGNAENTIQVNGICVNVDAEFKIPSAKISARGIDLTVDSDNNCGSNFGVYSEAGGKTDVTRQTIGTIGLANDGVVRIGTVGAINKTRGDLSADFEVFYTSSGLHTGGYFCNPNVGSTEYAIYSDGRTFLNGPVDITGDVTFPNATGNSLVSNVVCVNNKLLTDRIEEKTTSAGIEVKGDLFPESDLTYDLGRSDRKWNEVWVQDLTVCGLLTANINANIQYVESLTVDHFVANVAKINGSLCVDTIAEKSNGSGVTVEGVLIQDSNVTADYVTANNVCINQKLFVDEILPKTGNSIMTGNLQVDRIVEKTLNNGVFIEGILVKDTTIMSETVVADNIIGNLMGNVQADLVVATNVCVNDNLLTDGIEEKTPSAGIEVKGNLFPESDLTYDLGRSDRKWNKVWVQDLTVCGLLTANINANIQYAESLTVNNFMANIAKVCEELQVDTITEKSNGVGVTVEGVLIQDSNVTANYVTANNVCINQKLFVDEILPKTGNSIMTGNLQVDRIVEKTLNNGVFIEGILFRDTTVTSETVVADNIIGNLMGNVQADLVVATNVCVNDKLIIDEIDAKNNGDINVNANLIPTLDRTYTIGNLTNKWANVYTDDLTVCGNGYFDGNLIVNGKICGNLDINVTTDTIRVAQASGYVLGDGSNTNTFNSSVTRNSVGRYTVTFSPALPNDDYEVFLQHEEDSDFDDITIAVEEGTKTITGFDIFISEQDNGSTPGVFADKNFSYQVLSQKIVVTSVFKQQSTSGNLVIGGKLTAAELCVTGTSDLIGTLTVVDACVSHALTVSTIIEKTANAGVTIDGVLLIDGNLMADVVNANVINTQDILATGNVTAQRFSGDLVANQVVSANINTDNLTSTTITSNTIESSNVCVNDTLFVDTILEKTLDNGVSVDGVTLKDNTVTADVFTGNLTGNVDAKNVDVDNLNVNVDINVVGNVCIQGSQLQVDIINEKTVDNGVVVDGVFVKDNTVCANVLLVSNIVAKNEALGVSVTGNVYPSQTDIYEFGSKQRKWGNIVTQNLLVCGNANVVNDLTVGNLISVDTVVATTNVTTKDLCVTGNLFTDTLFSKNGDDITFRGNLVPETGNTYNIGSPSSFVDRVYTNNLTVLGGDNIQLGCLISISDTRKIVGDVANNNQWFTISEYESGYNEVVYIEARLAGIASDALSSVAGIVRAGIINNGTPPGNLIRMNGTDVTTFNNNASNWGIRLVPNNSGGPVTGNTIQVQGRFNFTGGDPLRDVTWRSCISLYTIQPI